MKITDLARETYEALVVNKVRSGLTMLGIVIGIASVIAMVAIGNGAQNTISSSIQSLGSNLLVVSPGAQRSFGGAASSGRGSSQSLTPGDAEAIAGLEGVKAVSSEASGRQQVVAKGTNTNTQVIGATPAYAAVRNVEMEEGSFIAEQQARTGARVAVLGPTVRDDLFGEGAAAIGQSVRIKGGEYKVVGITKSKGSTGFNNADDVVYVPLSAAQRYLIGNEYLTGIAVQAIDETSMAPVQAAITSLLLERHKIKDPTAPDFNVFNQADIVATASSITSTFTLLLGSVAGISLVVGGIGIMNMMLTTVTERTREIGLRKAIGAKRRDINLQFLGESLLLTFVGGIIGILLGWLITVAIAQFGGIAAAISSSSVVMAFGVSAAIGIGFGYYPARRASRLNPIVALRYE